jgi:rhamnopyranosyl-N-acetylglucosaminyl-diphospho-decaprenol beta-1,3/1,4-galactofuranosyltransferase
VAETNAAIVVAFNRKTLLVECLNGLLAQTLPLDAIYVVDNASTDGTDVLLHEMGYLDHPTIRYLRLDVNGGGAGGFYHGMREAFEAGYDWLWLMDDDTEPEVDALRLMESLKACSEVVAIANEKLDVRGEKTLDGLRMFPDRAGQSGAYPLVKFSSFVGLLIGSKAVKQIGFPRAEFFIHNDDHEYCVRLLKIGKIALAEGSRVVHKEQGRQIEPRRYFGFSYLPKDIYGYCFDYFHLRNFVVTQREHGSWLTRHLFSWRRFCLALAAILFIDKGHKWMRFKILCRAYLDGYRDRFDNSYPFRLREKLKASSAQK